MGTAAAVVAFMRCLLFTAVALFSLCTPLGSCARDEAPAEAARSAEVHNQVNATRTPSAVRASVDASLDDARARHAEALERMNRVDARRSGR